jgi:putative FmdB family regulatory protein
MPLYEYYCEKCDNVFEALGSIAVSEQPAKCPKCGRQAFRIMPTTFASMMRNSESAARFFRLPPNRVVELGAQIEF